MLQKKQKTNPLAEDIALLMESMDRVVSGDFTLVDTSAFHEPALAEKYNQTLNYILGINNGFVMKMNKAMSRISDGAVTKDMLEEVISQTSSISDMRDSSRELGDSIQNIKGAAQNIQDNSHGLTATSNACSSNMNTRSTRSTSRSSPSRKRRKRSTRSSTRCAPSPRRAVCWR